MNNHKKNISLINEARESMAEGAQGAKYGFRLLGRTFRYADEYVEVFGETSIAIAKDKAVARHLNATIEIENEIEEAKAQLEKDRARRAEGRTES
jgi:hypothetical protein